MLSEPPVELVELSVVVPCKNEADNLEHLFERLQLTLEPLGIPYEIICVNDGSQDNTLEKLIAFHRRDPRIKVVNLSRCYGKEIALTAGLDHASGRAVVPIDADLQDPPELIPEMLQQWRQGYQVVYAVRRSRRGESWLKRFTANGFYWLIDQLSQVRIPRNTGDFRLLDRQVVEAVKQLRERTRFMKGIFAWVGYRQTAIFYDRAPRFRGKTQWNYWRLWNLAIEGITSFSSWPLRVWSYIGLAISVPAFLYGLFLIIRTLLFGSDVPGYASLAVMILFLGGIQLISLGVIGEYLGRVFEEVKGRPLYLVNGTFGFETPRPSPALDSVPTQKLG
ncbi:glycosyltransferase family 2 protein [Synechococcus sp. R3-13]|uniref:glycosyltransferase family 2 protein n=1 Tax=Synechococcus sp. R3-13 TaxID=2421316 RepID=UPI0039C0FC96